MQSQPDPNRDACPDDLFLDRYRARKLSVEERVAFDRHLDACSRCQGRLDSRADGLTHLRAAVARASNAAELSPPEIPGLQVVRTAEGQPVLLGRGGYAV